MEQKLIANRWRTPDGTILYSRYRHEMVCHTDANGRRYCVDGGTDYIKHSYEGENDMVSECIYDDGTQELRREWLHWGTNFDKDMNRLPETLWRPIKDLSTSHIEAIINTQACSDGYYRELFFDELIYRQK